MIIEFSMHNLNFQIGATLDSGCFRLDAKNDSMDAFCWFVPENENKKFFSGEIQRWKRQCENFEKRFPGILKEVIEIVSRAQKIGVFE
jgi:hypothetical protein